MDALDDFVKETGKDIILSKDKFKMLPKSEQIKTLIHWREKYDTATIVEAMQMSRPAYYGLASELGVTKKYQTKQKPKQKPESKQVTPVITPEPVPEAVVSPEAFVKGLVLAYAGEYTADEIIRKLDKIGLILSDEENKFEVEIKINEVAK